MQSCVDPAHLTVCDPTSLGLGILLPSLGIPALHPNLLAAIVPPLRLSMLTWDQKQVPQ